MKKKDFEKLGKSILPVLPGFTVNGSLLFVQPIGHVLRAVCFDGSSFDANLFFVHVFLQPMFVPASHIIFNIGWRLGGGSHRWDIKDANIQNELGAALKREVLPFLKRVESAQDFVAAIESLPISADAYARQATAYAWAMAGNVERSVEEIEKLVRMLNVKVSWQNEMVERAEMIKKKLLDDPSKAQAQLEAWESATLQNLGLEKFRH